MFDYDATPGSAGGFTPVRSGSAGYVNLSQGIPFYSGRSQIATIPEFERQPGLLEKDALMTIKEKGSNLAKILLAYAERNGVMEKDDVRFWWRTEVVPHPRFYLKTGVAFTVSSLQTTFQLESFTRPTQSYPIAGSGNPKVIGDIARLQAGDFMLCMWSWMTSARTGAPVLAEVIQDHIQSKKSPACNLAMSPITLGLPDPAMGYDCVGLVKDSSWKVVCNEDTVKATPVLR